jgi:beta-lactamase regulating signal transducer with metallopeptidase domain
MPEKITRNITANAIRIQSGDKSYMKPMAAPSDKNGLERNVLQTLPAWATPLTIWMLGALLPFLYLLAGIIAVTKLKQNAREIIDGSWIKALSRVAVQLRLRRTVTLRQSTQEIVPMLVGWCRPTLILPASAPSWTDERKQLVLLHELAHAKRLDCLTQLLGQLLCVIYWFNPLAWLATQRLRREREDACDDMVLSSGYKGSDYAGHLLSIACNSHHPHTAQAVAVAMARRRGIELRICALLDAKRNRQGVAFCTTLIAIVIGLTILAVLSCARGARAQDSTAGHTKLRQQWQPSATGARADKRLDQNLTLDIVGRAAIPALKLLSQKTGVSLVVAPEDLGTVGERKLTIFARKLTLKSLMVQIPDALQECHWDIMTKGNKPVYLLHRNSGVNGLELTKADIDSRFVAPYRPMREARLAAAKQALNMAPAQLAELEKTDPLLAHAVQDHETRKWMELFLYASPATTAEFIKNGNAELALTDAPEELSQAVTAWLQEEIKRRHDDEGDPTFNLRRFLDNPAAVNISYEGVPTGEDGFNISFTLLAKKPGEMSLGCGPGLAIPPLNNGPGGISSPLQDMLIRSGMDHKAAQALLNEQMKKAETAARAAAAKKNAEEGIEPKDARLHQDVSVLQARQFKTLSDLQRALADKLGYSVISDYYINDTMMGRGRPLVVDKPMPVWKLLHQTGQRLFAWHSVGDCLIFHSTVWFWKAPAELPESFTIAYRQKLAQQGRFTIEDVVVAAKELAGRPILARGMPADLRLAGMTGDLLRSENDKWDAYFNQNKNDNIILRLYGSLSDEQHVKARSAKGLSYDEMTVNQQQMVQRKLARLTWRMKPKPAPEVATSAMFFAQEPGNPENMTKPVTYELALRFSETDPQVGGVLSIQLKPVEKSALLSCCQ